ncbi:MAG: SufD family Fe-S cluster assembly protein [Oscillospiraceae bacterium]|nr:SufD family Fe-S cluster assembly protein [Oscillospiraceae bacterium]
MNDITGQLLKVVSDWDGGSFKGAYNIREDSGCAGRQSSENIKIEPKTDDPGIVIRISAKAQRETVYIPACITKGGVDDLVYNDFIVEDGADVIIVAGCGVHSDDEEESRHNGIHRFFIGKNAKVLYKEKHIGTGKGNGAKRIDPVTDVTMGENSYMEMDTMQIGGVTSSDRSTSANLGAGAKLVIRERLLTDNNETARSVFNVTLDGDDSAVDLVSRSVAKGNSYQEYTSVINGNCRCTGHSECDAILADNGRVNAAPALNAASLDASLIHEAAIGKIAGEQIIKLRTLGLTEEEAERKIIDGFLK